MSEDLSWMLHGLCREVGGDFWFPDAHESAEPAKRICGACPVATRCLTFALQSKVTAGIWGGLDERERHRLRKARRPARPKLDVAA